MTSLSWPLCLVLVIFVTCSAFLFSLPRSLSFFPFKHCLRLLLYVSTWIPLKHKEGFAPLVCIWGQATLLTCKSGWLLLGSLNRSLNWISGFPSWLPSPKDQLISERGPGIILFQKALQAMCSPRLNNSPGLLYLWGLTVLVMEIDILAFWNLCSSCF